MFRRIFTAAALALSIGMATVPAFATDFPAPKEFFDQIVEATKDSAVKFSCYDPMDKGTCQTRKVATFTEGDVSYVTWADKTVAACFYPAGAKYAICTNGDKLVRMIRDNVGYRNAPKDDERCSGFGGNFSEEYLACEAALPIKS